MIIALALGTVPVWDPVWALGPKGHTAMLTKRGRVSGYPPSPSSGTGPQNCRGSELYNVDSLLVLNNMHSGGNVCVFL